MVVSLLPLRQGLVHVMGTCAEQRQQWHRHKRRDVGNHWWTVRNAPTSLQYQLIESNGVSCRWVCQPETIAFSHGHIFLNRGRGGQAAAASGHQLINFSRLNQSAWLANGNDRHHHHEPMFFQDLFQI